MLYSPKCETLVSDKWDVELRSLPGHGSCDVKGDGVFHLSTVMDGKVAVTGCTVREEETVTASLDLRYKIMANPGDPFILRMNKALIAGRLAHPA